MGTEASNQQDNLSENLHMSGIFLSTSIPFLSYPLFPSDYLLLILLYKILLTEIKKKMLRLGTAARKILNEVG